MNPAQLERRVEIAAERRERMRVRLLVAAYRLFAVHGSDAPTIDDVVEEAGVARGTFYNHFQTRDDLFKEVADHMASSINAVILPRIRGIEDPAERIALSFRIFIHFAVSDEARGWILLRTMPLVSALNMEMKRFVYSEFEDAIAQKRFKIGSPEIAVDLGFGLQITTIQRLLVDHGGDTHIDRAAEELLVAMGVARNEARRIARTPLDFESFPPLPSSIQTATRKKRP